MNIRGWREAQKAESSFWKSNIEKGTPIPPESLYRYERCLKFFPLSINYLTRILDVGSGPHGGVPVFISRSCFKVSLDPLIGKKSFATMRSLKKPTNSIQAVGEYLPFTQNAFNVIFCVNALDHSCEPLRILNEMNRVLYRKGVLIMMVNVVAPKDKIIHSIICETKFRKISFAIEHLRNFSHIIDRFFLVLLGLMFRYDILNDGIFHPFYFAFNDVVALLNEAGFAINKIRLYPSPWNYKKDLFLAAQSIKSDLFLRARIIIAKKGSTS